MRALALEHLHSNPVGAYGEVLEERGIDVKRVRMDLLEPLPDWRDYELLVVMGGGMSVYQEDAYPWLADEKRAIREAVTSGLPYFGVCLGSQLLASSFGARVFKGAEPELGVSPVFLCEPAQRDPVFRGFPFDLEVFEWHTDTFDLPAGGVRLARSPRYENQAFRIGAVAYAMQCHLETTLDEVRNWFAEWPALVEVFEGRYGTGSLDVFLGEYEASVPHLRDSARQLFGRWLENALTAQQPISRPTLAATAVASGLLGRDDERARITRFLDAARGGRSAAVLLRGDTGIGKTAVLDDSAASAIGMGVIRLAGLDSEVETSSSGLEELCRPLLSHLDRVPREHADALGAVLGLGDGAHQGDRFAAYAGVLDLLAEAAIEQPLLLYVDDAHLLDETTLEALGFVAGRIEAEGVVLLVATGGGPIPGEAAFESIELGPLDAGAALALLERRFGAALSPHVAAELIAAAEGNPLALIEITLSLSAEQRGGAEPVEDVLRTRRSAEHALLARIAALPDRTRRALLLPAIARTGDLAVIERALAHLGLEPADLRAAEHAGFVSIDDQVTFTHGLVRSTVAYGAVRMERREAHAALARAIDPNAEPEAATWHAALAASQPDEGIALALERTAGAAAGRRAHAAAARAYERAARLSPDGSARARRLVRAGEEAGLAGHTLAAIDHLTVAVPDLPDPAERSHAERLLGRLLARTGSAERARDVLLAAAQGAAERAEAARALTDAVIPALRAGDPAQACDIGRRALAQAEGLDPSSVIGSAVALGTALLLSGSFTEGRELAVHAAMLADSAGEQADLQLRSYLGGALRLAGEYERAREVLMTVVGDARSRGSAGVLAYALARLGDVELDQGRWTRAIGSLIDASTLATETGQGADLGLATGGLAWLAAVQGREHECLERARHALLLAERLGVGSSLARAAHAPGLLALGLGRFDEAADELVEAIHRKVGRGWSDASVAPHWAPDLIEAQVLAGRVNEARAELASFGAEAERAGRSSSLAALARCRALLSSDDEARKHLDDALAFGVDTTGPFERARTELTYGERLNQGDRDEAERLLTSAFARFSELGAEPWSNRAREGLRRLGIEEPGIAPSPLGRLSERELQVALAVGDGMSTRDASTNLMLTMPTVERHLNSALRNLGVTSVDELSVMLEADAAADRD